MLSCLLLGLAYAVRIALSSDTKSCGLWNQNELNLTRVGSSIGLDEGGITSRPNFMACRVPVSSSTPAHSNQI